MKKFDFRLAGVLRLREIQLIAEKTKLQGFLAEQERLLKDLASIDKERKESLHWVQSSSTVTSGDVRALSAFLLGSQAREAAVRKPLEACKRAIDDQRGRVLIAERNRKLLLKLREKRLIDWQYAADRELEAIAQEAWQSAHRRPT